MEDVSSSNDKGLTFETVLQAIPIYSITLLILEACKQIIYYKYFQFNIVPYLNISYLFSSFLGSAAAWIMSMLLAGQMFSIFFDSIIQTFFPAPEPDHFTLTAKQRLLRIRKIRCNRNWGKRIGMTVLVPLIVGALILIYYYPELTPLFYLLLFDGSIIYSFYRLKYRIVKADKPITKYIYNYGLFVFIALIIYPATATFPAIIKMHNQVSRSIRLVCRDTKGNLIEYPEHSVNYFIGNTTEFYFIYSLMDSSTHVIKAQDVLELVSIKDIQFNFIPLPKK